jgi:hypothetical protein
MFIEGEHILCVRSQEKNGPMWSGYWDNFTHLANFMVDWDCDEVEATYVCTNPCDPAQVKVTNNFSKYSSSLSASEVLYRYNLMVDVDTIKHHGDVATVEERQASFKVCMAIHAYLMSLGFPEPSIYTSGNGYHIEIRPLSFPAPQKTKH